MTILHPSIETIARGYAEWLAPRSRPVARERSLDSPASEEQGFAPDFEDTGAARVATDDLDAALTMAPTHDASVPAMVADAIRRQTSARPSLQSPQSGDLIVLSPAVSKADEPVHPVAILLDEPAASGWSGWLVGAHVDYAGDRDLVLESSLIEGGLDPAPLAGMVLCWDRVSLKLSGQAHVLHHLTDSAMQVVRTLANRSGAAEEAPAPGRMCLREIEGMSVVTGLPYLRDDPRTPYLRLARELARRVSEPEFDDQGRAPQPDRGEPER